MNISEEIKETRQLAFEVIEILQNRKIEVWQWEKIKSFIDYQYMHEKNKSILNYDKNALSSLIYGQIW